LGKNGSNVIEHITALTKNERGTRALMFLVTDMMGRGVVNDNEREGHEENLNSYELEINMGLVSNQARNKGKLSDQDHIIRFREQARDKLSHWLGVGCMSTQAILTMSGIAYDYTLRGEVAASVTPDGKNEWTQLSYAADVSAPTSARHFYFDGTDLQPGNTAAITSSCLPTYAMLVNARAHAESTYMPKVRKGGWEGYIYWCDPRTLAALKQDSDFLSAVSNAGDRGKKNPVFSGMIETIDGIMIMCSNLTYNTSGAASGSKWGAGGAVDGTRSLLLGAQALGMADIGAPSWVEKDFDYGSKQGISIDKFLGFRKTKYYNPYSKSTEDFGVIAIDLYLNAIL
jgi:N4-gp56 family major capsid protein